MTLGGGDYDPSLQVEVHQLKDVFNTGKTPELTYTPRTRPSGGGGTYDMYLAGRARRGTGGVLVYGLSKSGKTSLVERAIPKTGSIWLDGTRLRTIDDFWNTLAYRLGLHTQSTAEASEGQQNADTIKGSLGPKAIASVGADIQSTVTAGSKETWTFSGMTPEQVVDALAERNTPVVIDDFHHISSELRDAISEAIKPILRTNFVVVIAIPSHAFDPESASADLAGRIEQMEFPTWSVEELLPIAVSGFRELQIVDPHSVLATALARRSFGSPHIMQDLCYAVMEHENVRETGPMRTLSIPEDLDQIVAEAADAVEPFAFKHMLKGRPTKGQQRILINLRGGGTTDTYGITFMAIRTMIPPMELEFRSIRAKANLLANEDIHQNRILSALTGISDIAQLKKGNADPIFSYREEYAYIQDPILAFYLRYGGWMSRAVDGVKDPTLF